MSHPFRPTSIEATTETLFWNAQNAHERLQAIKDPRTARCTQDIRKLRQNAIKDLDAHIRSAYNLDAYTNNGHFDDHDIATSGISVNARLVLRRVADEADAEVKLQGLSGTKIPLLFTGVTPLTEYALSGAWVREFNGVFLEGVDINQAFSREQTEEAQGPFPVVYVPFTDLQILSTASRTFAMPGGQPA